MTPSKWTWSQSWIQLQVDLSSFYFWVALLSWAPWPWCRSYPALLWTRARQTLSPPGNPPQTQLANCAALPIHWGPERELDKTRSKIRSKSPISSNDKQDMTHITIKGDIRDWARSLEEVHGELVHGHFLSEILSQISMEKIATCSLLELAYQEGPHPHPLTDWPWPLLSLRNTIINKLSFLNECEFIFEFVSVKW